MTEQSPTAQFTASSFLDGANADYVDQLAARHAADPNSVDPQWAAFFRALGDSEIDTKRAASGPSWARADWPPQPTDDLTAALTGEWAAPPAKDAKATADKITAKAAEAGVSLSDTHLQRAVLDSIRALMIIRAYRIRGHLAADLDPLKITERGSKLRRRPRDQECAARHRTEQRRVRGRARPGERYLRDRVGRLVGDPEERKAARRRI